MAAQLVEPGTPPPTKRLAVMRRLVRAGVSCGVFLTPILPGITDSATSVDAVAVARVYGASSFGTSVLRLAPLVREHYLGFVADRFPALLHRYERAYAGANARPDYLAAMERRVTRIRERHGFAGDAMRAQPRPALQPVAGIRGDGHVQGSLPLFTTPAGVGP